MADDTQGEENNPSSLTPSSLTPSSSPSSVWHEFYDDEKYHQNYYYNYETLETTWVKPEGKDTKIIQNNSSFSPLFLKSTLAITSAILLGGGFAAGLSKQKRQHTNIAKKSPLSIQTNETVRALAVRSATRALLYATIISTGGMGLLVAGTAYATGARNLKEFGVVAKRAGKGVGQSVKDFFKPFKIKKKEEKTK
eukprot:g2474.t1